jgi:hypothetical protein
MFNIRSANADDHGKNHSFLFEDSRGLLTLLASEAPAKHGKRRKLWG